MSSRRVESMVMAGGSVSVRERIMKGSFKIIERKALEFPSKMAYSIGDYSRRTSQMARESTHIQVSLQRKT